MKKHEKSVRPESKPVAISAEELAEVTGGTGCAPGPHTYGQFPAKDACNDKPGWHPGA